MHKTDFQYLLTIWNCRNGNVTTEIRKESLIDFICSQPRAIKKIGCFKCKCKLPREPEHLTGTDLFW